MQKGEIIAGVGPYVNQEGEYTGSLTGEIAVLFPELPTEGVVVDFVQTDDVGQSLPRA